MLRSKHIYASRLCGTQYAPMNSHLHRPAVREVCLQFGCSNSISILLRSRQCCCTITMECYAISSINQSHIFSRTTATLTRASFFYAVLGFPCRVPQFRVFFSTGSWMWLLFGVPAVRKLTQKWQACLLYSVMDDAIDYCEQPSVHSGTLFWLHFS